ncbi:MAG: sigma-70 family RNA polymerase sigma factor [Bacteroidales bacterium]|nr:sigma-70 family RNA polymerase sigma factor [Bacteroidales bacterium]
MELGTELTKKAKRDYELVKLAINHSDQSAYAELMNNYRDTVYFMLLKMTNNEVDAEDLTIEAFGKAFKNLSNYTPDFAFSTWLFKIASNNCIDFIRRRKKKELSLDDPFDDGEGHESTYHIASEGPDPEEVFMKEQKVKIMREVVEQLKPHYRKLIKLRYFDEYSYEEISETLNLPLGTVKAQLFRAREFLYNIIKRKGDQI